MIGNVWQNQTWKRTVEVDAGTATGPLAKGAVRGRLLRKGARLAAMTWHMKAI